MPKLNAAKSRNTLSTTVTSRGYGIRASPSEVFQIETDDACRHDRRRQRQAHRAGLPAAFSRLAKATPGLFNPVVGPIYVEGCKAGDVLAVKIDWIDPWRYGFSGVIPRMGPLGDSLRYKECAEGYVHVIEHARGRAVTRATAPRNIPRP